MFKKLTPNRLTLNAKEGFTLIELLVVISIIGILASIVLVNLGSFRAKGRDARRIADLRSVQSALELYYSKNGVYPPGRGAGVAGWTAFTADLVGADVGVAVLPKDPSGAAKFYTYSTTDAARNGYILRATLEQDNSVLLSDLDGTQNVFIAAGTATLECGAADTTDRDYCIQF